MLDSFNGVKTSKYIYKEKNYGTAKHLWTGTLF